MRETPVTPVFSALSGTLSSTYSDRPPDAYYVKAEPHAAVPAINEAMETIG
jgi:hypothetical protein